MNEFLLNQQYGIFLNHTIDITVSIKYKVDDLDSY